ncbi:phosphate/phosphite/phosphonate ABC transporter substrate-binding protein [Sphingomonas solaris]|uniref:PhnD/SsuA/transferrin family substrate-binding protein n=1 Tax=Alterirhizorhabdus solaris TaxID=2529389 RepID=A0A558QVB7_9SPHN|nr:PhnD/SsuA/transferrin family substrate-binding protein [Sphingomonas solaris]TVV71086.1 PhnD/SsuA/transferrin family substrate-binding protein [Sphingomonas solaris]
MRVASLGMYDRPEVRAANDRLWQAIATRLAARGVADVPEALDRARPLGELWDDPALLLGQTCGYPFVTTGRGRLRYVATPRYRVAGCSGARYRSRIVVRADDPAEKAADLRGARAAVNEWRSNSGMNLFRAAIAPLAARAPFFSEVVVTGGHDASARAVAEGRADVAAIDVVSFAHLQRWEPDVAARLRTVAWTPDAAGLPLVTSIHTSDADVAAIGAVLDEVAADPALEETRATLMIGNFARIAPARYEALLALEQRAIRAGYPTLA